MADHESKKPNELMVMVRSLMAPKCMIDIENSNAHRKRPVALCSHLYPKAVVILGHGPILHAKKRRQHDAVGKAAQH